MMPRRKLSPTEGPALGAAGTGGHVGSGGGVAPVVVPTGFAALPDEMLVKVFSYLGHGDKLCSRVVSKRWCRVISSWVGFNNSVVYLLKEGTDAKVTLKQSNVIWRKLRIEKFRLDVKGHEKINLPSHILNNVTWLEFSKCIVTWNAVKQIIMMFSSLEEIGVIQCKRRRKEIQSPPSVRMTRGHQIIQERWSAALQDVKSLTLELRRTSDLTFYLQQFQSGLRNLLVLDMRELYDGVEEVTSEACSALLGVLHEIISSSRRTLKNLKLGFVSKEVLNRFMPEVIERISTQHLNLVTFDVRNLGDVTFLLRDLRILSSFFRTQNNLLHVRLPNPGNVSAEELRRLMQALPRTVRYLQVPWDQYLFPNFLDMFPDLCHLETDCEIRPYVMTGKTYLNMCGLEIRDFVASSIPSLVAAFPKLVELSINSEMQGFGTLNDRGLQTIIQNLTSLRSLTLGTCTNITDYGVTGIRQSYCEKLFKSRSMCLDPSQEIPEEELAGVPLCSIKGLINLAFTEGTSISDVGIYFGFRFKELRYLNMRHNSDITDWGLDYLGKLNPNLEEMYLVAGSCVSPIGFSRIRTRMRRIRRRHLVLVAHNQDYYSSDDSYALESGDDPDSDGEAQQMDVS